MALIAASAQVSWAAPRLHAPPRVRPGALLTLRCEGADAFRLQWCWGPARVFAARAHGLRLPAPRPRAASGFAALTCTPLRAGAPCGPAAEVLVLAEPVVYGA